MPTESLQKHPWYALHVRSRQEKLVEMILRQKGLETFLPLYTVERRWASARRSVELPLISCYVFSRFEITRRMPVLTTPGVLSVVGIGAVPQPVEEIEIAAVQAIVASGYPAEPVEYLQCGDRVRIAGGPLAGLEGVLVSHKSRKRLIVSITLLQRSVAVELDQEHVKLVQAFARLRAGNYVADLWLGACRREGAHRMSGLSRAAVLSMIESGAAASANQTLWRIDRRLQAMQSLLDEMRRERNTESRRAVSSPAG